MRARLEGQKAMNEIIRALSKGGQIELARPEFLLLLFVIPIVFVIIFFHSRRGDLVVLRALKAKIGSRKMYVALFLVWSILFGSLSFIIANPKIKEYAPPETTPRGDYIILVDVSRSMDASPSPNDESQMEIARWLTREIVDKVGTARFQIYGFAKVTFSLSNLTFNRASLRDTINKSLHVGVIPREGSRLVETLAAIATKKISLPELQNVSHIILITDGRGSSTKFGEMIDMVNEAQLSVISIGVGSKSGWKIPLFDKQKRFTGKYAKLDSGGDYISKLEEENLKRISRQTEGHYFRYSQSAMIVSYINSTLSSDYEIIETDEVLRVIDIMWIFFFPLWFSIVVLSFIKRFY